MTLLLVFSLTFLYSKCQEGPTVHQRLYFFSHILDICLPSGLLTRGAFPGAPLSEVPPTGCVHPSMNRGVCPSHPPYPLVACRQKGESASWKGSRSCGVMAVGMCLLDISLGNETDQRPQPRGSENCHCPHTKPAVTRAAQRQSLSSAQMLRWAIPERCGSPPTMTLA